MSSMQEILERANAVLIQNYARQPIVMARGEGSVLFDVEGRRYIDLFAGFGGAILGHAHPALVEAAHAQARKLWHVGNTYHTEAQVEVAERMNRHAFVGKAFFCHSGLEANEAACKLARLRHKDSSPRRYKVISLHKSFHGRSIAMLAATGNPKVRVGFEPLPPGFVQVDFGDYEQLAAAVDSETAGVIMEPIQGEGGINLHPAGYVERVRELCDKQGLTLIFDEVWTGCGRTGRWFAHQYFERGGGGAITPDVMTLGKAIGGGLPVGVMFAKPELANLMVPGTHGCTLGGNPICMAVARTIFDVIERERLLDHANRLSEYAVSRLREEPRIAGKIAEVRGRGLMLGVELKDPPDAFLERALAKGLVVNLTAGKVIRLAPPINIPASLWQEGVDRLIDIVAAM